MTKQKINELPQVTDIPPMPKVKPPKDVEKSKSVRMLEVVRARRNRLEKYREAYYGDMIDSYACHKFILDSILRELHEIEME